MKILVIVAHPDDEVLGMGGTIAKHSANKDKIHVVYLTQGIKSRRSVKNQTRYEIKEKDEKIINNEIEKLKKNALKSNKILGVKDTKFYDLPDNELDSIPRLKIIKIIEKEIERIKPEIVYTNHYGDLNIDHRLVYEACLTACRPIKSKNPQLITFGVISSMEWNFPNSFNPNYFVNITNYVKLKIRAMKAYENEIRKFPHPRSIENIEITAKKMGTICGKKYSEAFEIIRIIED